jgi:exosome complex component RRP42
MSKMETSNLTVEKLKGMFESGKRFDGRGLLDHRPLEVSFDVSNKAEGSARVKLGKTEVIAGVKMSIGTPYADSPEKGNLSVSSDLLPLASPRFESGPPGFSSIELPRLVDRAIRECGMIQFEKLCVVPGDKVWTIMVDVYPINDDGNLIDAATIAALAALKNATFPGLKEDNTVDYSVKTDKKLPLSDETHPFQFTFFKLGNSLILDPTREEEEACDVRITLGISKWNGQYMVNSCQKTGETTFTQQEIEKMFLLLPKKFDELNEKLKKFL